MSGSESVQMSDRWQVMVACRLVCCRVLLMLLMLVIGAAGCWERLREGRQHHAGSVCESRRTTRCEVISHWTRYTHQSVCVWHIDSTLLLSSV